MLIANAEFTPTRRGQRLVQKTNYYIALAAIVENWQIAPSQRMPAAAEMLARAVIDFPAQILCAIYAQSIEDVHAERVACFVGKRSESDEPNGRGQRRGL